MRLSALVAVFVMLAPLAAEADMVWHQAYKNPWSDWGSYMYDQNVKRHMRERTSGKSAQAPQRAALSASDFRRDPRARGVLVARFVAGTQVRREEAVQLERTLIATIAEIEKVTRRDNVASAIALSIALSFEVLGRDDYRDGRGNQLAATVNDVLAVSPQFARLAAADRQTMADSMLLSAALLVLLDGAGEKAASQELAKQLLSQLTGVAAQ
jgi:hypothetical protein